jgi:tetratricopeptide (TPR) repeat protein
MRILDVICEAVKKVSRVLWARHAAPTVTLYIAALCIASWFCEVPALSQTAQPATNTAGPAQTTAPTPRQATEAAAGDFAGSRHLLQLGKFDEAIAQLLDVQSQNPALPGLSRELGAAYYKKGDFVNAAKYLSAALDENAHDDEATQLLGLSYYLAGRPAQAIPQLEKVQTWYPSANVDAAYILGICYIQTKDYPQARRAFAKMFDVGLDSAASYLFTARMLLRQDFGPVAEEYASKASAIDPQLPMAHELLGELYLYQSKIPEAVAQFQAELAINPGYAAAYYKLADAQSRLQKYDDAERLLQRSIWLDPTSTGPYILLGKVLEKKGEAELSARALQRALTMDPNNPIPHHLLGQTYRDLGRTDDAERELKLAEQLQSHQNEKP